MEPNRNEKRGLIRAALSFAFDGVIENAVSWIIMLLSFLGYVLLGTIVLVLVGIGGMAMVNFLISNEISIAAVIVSMVGLIALILLAIGYLMGIVFGITRTVIQFYDTHIVHYKPIMSIPMVLSILVANFLQWMLIGIGLILFIIPGIVAYLRSMFTFYIIVDKNIGPVQAIKLSWKLTRGRYNIMIGFGIVTILIGMVPLIGWLMASLMTAYMYRSLEKETVL